MIDALFKGILNLVVTLVNILLYPIDALISSMIPSLDYAFTVVNDFISKLIKYVGFVISYTGLTATTINVIISLAVFIYSAPILVHGIKLSVKWFKVLRG